MLAQFLRRSAHSISPNILRRIGNMWLPFWGAGIVIHKVSDDYRYIEVIMRLRWYNKNYVGTHFGGSMYAMTDPFYMMMLINNLGKSYIVWDKGACIDFVQPGRGKLTAIFELNDSIIEDVKANTESGEKYIFHLPVDIKNENDEIVASVKKTLYVRKKRKQSPSQ